MTDLREAARHVVDLGSSPPDIRRVVVAVPTATGDELVSLIVEGEDARATCTCGVASCLHASQALRWVAGVERVETAKESAVVAGPAVDRRSLPGPARYVAPAGDPQHLSLAEAVDEMLTSIVRTGVANAASPTIESALQRLLEAAPQPTPLGVARWLGRFRAALGRADALGAARLLEGAARVSQALRTPSPDEADRARIAAWLGRATTGLEEMDRVQDRTLYEIARERVHGLTRDGLERRYLVDAETHEVFREEGEVMRGGVSVGPCPRRIDVGLAEVERTVAPRRLHLMQYAVSLDVPTSVLRTLAESGVRLFRALRDEYASACRQFPSLAEPFVIVAPARVERHDKTLTLVDDAGDPLALAYNEQPGAAQVLAAWSKDAAVRAVAGRLVDAAAQVMLVPCAALLEVNGELVHRRLS